MAKDRLEKFRRILRLHTNWLVAKMLGPEALSENELKELKSFGKLPLGDGIDFIKKSYVLGRLRAILSSSEYKNVTSEGLEDVIGTLSLSKKEELMLREVRLHAAKNLKRISDDIAAGAFDRFSEEFSGAVTEAVIREAVTEATELAIKEKQSFQQMAANLSATLKDSWSRDWERVAITELQRAKVRGEAMAIANKVSVYGSSDGVDSSVSVIVSDACEDCKFHYLESDGTPKVFTLRSLLTSGSNADSDVHHKRGSNGRHTGWKTTLPPLHPGCDCYLVYVPPGMGWVSGRLKVLDEETFKSTLAKAVDTGSSKPTIKPPGPKSSQGASSPAASAMAPPSVPGAAAPSNMPGPGKPASGGGPKVEWEYWKGDGQPPAEGGWEQSPSGAWRRPKGSGGGPGSAEMEEAKRQLTIQEAKNWGKFPHEHQKVLNHLSEGEIADKRSLVGFEAGVNPIFQITIAGNGRGAMKPTADLETDHRLFIAGCGTVVHGTTHKNEAAAYPLMVSLGLDHCPPTTLRNDENGVPHSVQQWQEDHAPAADLLVDKFGENGYAESFTNIMNASEDPEAFKTKMLEMITVDLIMNNNDRHFNNFMFDEDMKSVKAIDNGLCFAAGMMGTLNLPMKRMASGGYKVTIPEKLHTKMKNTSLGDMKRTLGDTLEDWQVGQTFLRMQYISHLQETEGELDYKKFQPWMYTQREDLAMPGKVGWIEDSYNVGEYILDPRKRANGRFEDFSIDWMDMHANDPSSPHHEAAKELLELGVFMGPTHVVNAAEYRSSGKHKEYEQKIRKEKVVADNDRGPLHNLKGSYSDFEEMSPITSEETTASSEEKGTAAGKKVPASASEEKGTAAGKKVPASASEEKGTAAGKKVSSARDKLGHAKTENLALISTATGKPIAQVKNELKGTKHADIILHGVTNGIEDVSLKNVGLGKPRRSVVQNLVNHYKDMSVEERNQYAVAEAVPLKAEWDPSAKKFDLVDGRHRVAVARQMGITHHKARVVVGNRAIDTVLKVSGDKSPKPKMNKSLYLENPDKPFLL